MSSVWQPFLSTLAGAFTGAWFAFLFNSNRERKRADDDNVRNGNLALYNITEYWTELQLIHDDEVEPFLSNDAAWFQMRPTSTPYIAMPSISNLDLSFVLQSDHISVYPEVLRAARQYESLRRVIDQRDSMIIDRVWPALDRAGIKEGEKFKTSDVESAVGTDAVRHLQHLTTTILSDVPQNLVSLQNSFRQLRGVMLELYPNHDVVECDFKLNRRLSE